jgi:NAD(P)-dependent dehydrogenase (short-subunit alcohol dehydrogenase family)
MAIDSRPEVVVVTGASAGVGRAVVQAFAKRGAYIGLLARGEAGLAAARRDVERLGGHAISIPVDTADYDAVEAAAQLVEDRFGPIDIWVNDGFTTVFAEFLETTPGEFRRVTEVTYLGFVHGTMAALKRMVPHDRGKIIQVGSALSYVSIPLQSAYCGAKHAINGFTSSVRIELMHHKSNVKISIAQLPAVNTPQFVWGRNKMPRKAEPVPPIYQPEVIAEAIYWLAHHDRRELWIGGSTVRAILGAKFAPGIAERYLSKTGYMTQMRHEPLDPNQPDNLYYPADATRDYGAHGPFDPMARGSSYETWASEHAGAMTAAAAFGIAVLGLAGMGMIALPGLMHMLRVNLFGNGRL